MKCPACAHELSEKQADSVVVDVCAGGCGGIWFDDRELKKFDDLSDVAGTELLAVERSPSVKVDFEKIRYCPRCTAEELCRRFYDVHRSVEVDQCLRCSGIWLDVGELKILRDQYASEDARKSAVDHYLGQHLEETEDSLQISTLRRLVAWEDDVSFRGVLRGLFRGLLGS